MKISIVMITLCTVSMERCEKNEVSLQTVSLCLNKKINYWSQNEISWTGTCPSWTAPSVLLIKSDEAPAQPTETQDTVRLQNTDSFKKPRYSDSQHGETCWPDHKSWKGNFWCFCLVLVASSLSKYNYQKENFILVFHLLGVFFL